MPQTPKSQEPNPMPAQSPRPVPGNTVPKGGGDREPHWDEEAQILSCGSQVIKRFIHDAWVQRLVLNEFQKQGWPQFIDDPLPHRPNRNPKTRLRHVICHLNEHHLCKAIQFFADGTGRRIGWRHV